jgi:drug/metabolite transporter (DMT)-like permease
VTSTGLNEQRPPRLAPDILGLAALVAGALAISAAPILVRLAQTGPAAAGFWRLALAAPLLIAARPRSAIGGLGLPSPLMLLAGVMFALDLGCWHYGIRFTSVANATVLPNLNPVLVTAGAWVLLKERPRPVFLVGMGVAVSGAILMALADKTDGAGGMHPRLGDALSAATAVWYAVYFLAVRAARRHSLTVRIMMWTSLIGAPILFAAALALGEPLLPRSAAGWPALGGLALVHVAGQGAIAWALGRVQAPVAALMILVQPLAAAGLAWLMFGERLSPLQAFGGALALAGIVFAQLRGHQSVPVAS